TRDRTYHALWAHPPRTWSASSGDADLVHNPPRTDLRRTAREAAPVAASQCCGRAAAVREASAGRHNRSAGHGDGYGAEVAEHHRSTAHAAYGPGGSGGDGAAGGGGVCSCAARTVAAPVLRCCAVRGHGGVGGAVGPGGRGHLDGEGAVGRHRTVPGAAARPASAATGGGRCAGGFRTGPLRVR